MKKNKIFVVSAFSGPLDGSLSNRFVYIAKLLGQKHNVELLTTDFYHSKKEKIVKPHGFEDFELRQFKVPTYKANISIKRLWSHFVFALKIYFYLRNETDKRSIVYCSFPPIFLALFSFLGTKNKNNFVLDVQDLWPEVFYASVSNRNLKPFFFLHRSVVTWITKRTPNLVTVSNTYLEHFIDKGFNGKNKEVVFIGINFDEYGNFQQSTQKRNLNEITFIYAGTLGHSYNLEYFLRCFKKAQVDERCKKKLKLTIVGTGPSEFELKTINEELEIGAVFTGRISHKEVIERLKIADVAVNSMAPGMLQSIINKHGDYTFVGLPIISTQDNPEFKALIESHGFGINVDPIDDEALIEAILFMANNGQKRLAMAEKSRLVGKTLFNRSESYQRIDDLVNSLVIQ